MVFYGLLAAVFYPLLIGAVWPARDGAGLGEALLGQTGKSLWISWILVFVSYWLKLPDLLLPLLVVVALAVFLQWHTRRTHVGFASDPLRLICVMFVVAVVLLFCADILLREYSAIFEGWDSIVSWNRWAIELSDNEYNPMSAAYPVLFPGIWSLVYKAQGDTSVWFLAKLTLFTVPIMLGLSVILLVERRRFLPAAIVGIFVAYYFFVSHSVPMLSGYMDIPVAALMLLAGVCIFLATTSFSEGRVAEALSDTTLAGVFTGLSTITKAPGIILLALFFFMLVLAVINSHLRFRTAFGFSVVAALPLLCYLAIYLPLKSDLFGIVPHLEQLAKQSAKGESRFWHAFQLVWTMIPPAALLLAVAVGLVNVAKVKRIDGAMGVVFLVASFIGTLLYADCCSYDSRNGWWIISLVVLSAVFGLSSVDAFLLRKSAALSAVSIPTVAIPAVILVIGAASAAVIGLEIPDDRARQIQEDRQWKIIEADVNALIRSKLDVLGKDGMLVSSYQAAGWLPGMRARYSLCFPNDIVCVRAVAHKSPRVLSLVGKGGQDYPDLRPLLTPDKLLGAALGFTGTELYGPFNANELEPLNAGGKLKF
jgi:hypothetical protein